MSKLDQKMAEAQEIAHLTSQPPAVVPIQQPSDKIMMMIGSALEAGHDPGKINNIMTMYKESVEFEAKQAFRRDFSQMQAKIPPVSKTEKGQYGWYAPIDAIGRTLAPFLAEYGFSYRWENNQDMTANVISSACIITHQGGHEERSVFAATVDMTKYGVNSQGNAKGSNDMQRHAAAQTYANRRSLIDAFGITTTDNDTDGDTGDSSGNRGTSDGDSINANPSDLVDFGKYKGVPWMELPPDYLVWLRDNARKPDIKKKAERIIAAQKEPKPEDESQDETAPTKGEIIRAMDKAGTVEGLDNIWKICPDGHKPALKETYNKYRSKLEPIQH